MNSMMRHFVTPRGGKVPRILVDIPKRCMSRFDMNVVGWVPVVKVVNAHSGKVVRVAILFLVL